MTSSRMPWFRMYADFLNDPKLVALAFEDQRHFIGLLALKCDGALDGDIDPILLDRIVAQRLWIDHAVIRDVKRRLVQAGLIGDDWQPLGWEKRQFQSDSSTERTRRYREKKHQEKQQVAPVKSETSQERHSDALDTDTDTDTDTEKEEVKPARAARALPPPRPADVEKQVWDDFLAARKAKRAPLTATALEGIRREAGKAGVTLGEALRICCVKGWSSFNASWNWRDEMPFSASTHGFVGKQQALEAHNRAVAQQWLEQEGMQA